MRFLWLLCLIISSAVPSFAQTLVEPGLAEMLQTALDAERVRQSGADAGAVVAVDFGDGSLWIGSSGLNDRDSGSPMEPNGLFRAGSITKTFVAAEIMLLVEEGRIELTDTVEDILPGILPNGSQITLRQLLSNQSGLFDYTWDESSWNSVTLEDGDHSRVWEPEEMVAISIAAEPRFSPGARYEYSSTNFILLGMVIEEITGSPIAVEFRQRFFEPLGMQDTFLEGNEALPLPLVHSYDQGGLDHSLLPSTGLSTYAWAAGAIVSSANDLIRWTRLLYGGALLADESLRQMTDFSSFEYGLGTLPYDLRIGAGVGHSGSIPAFLSDAVYVPRADVSIVILLNTDHGNILQGVRNAMAGALAEQVLPDFPGHFPGIPQHDEVLLDEEEPFRVDARDGAQPFVLSADGPVFSGLRSAALAVEKETLQGWAIDGILERPADSFGFVKLRMAVHPGTATGSALRVLLNGKKVQITGLSAPEDFRIDLERQEWQVVEIPVPRIVTYGDTVFTFGLSGNLEGTLYIDDFRLVTVDEPPVPTAVVETSDSAVPASPYLQNYPNPFNPETTIRFDLSVGTDVELVLYNLAGQQAAILASGFRSAGSHSVRWDGRDENGAELASGAYLYRLSAQGKITTRKLLLMR